ncbi:putative Multidrug Resistance Associated Protein (MRP) [Monocercomonoides exilis]|uniref:putative Multidrug Resistance Associated Protein (MRP) n=1 Tax=Monocercomonoides exilis TaxID=2049356 RepID=UPI00355A49DC|nr:putative Multidrug Resistance Associated Protein (MRP) [Monocercomonoides exilis]|eukprot:MONOS_9633.1-p1 / transcript=MONOS_9633.1 / gene=MONOS_9633 / organism=Monocercomonoides_exilis_PA203 / gene_product=Multidrug Resistance Associated Protein (MRP) / transcript_product=Multidrug Resistance Associated Protein (MRP) / location=Mono_scaffold00404:11437-16377(-) / protein_length=1609 / sequence_SO=supercontig / SO=protein_coding / is_pseudo=false
MHEPSAAFTDVQEHDSESATSEISIVQYAPQKFQERSKITPPSSPSSMTNQEPSMSAPPEHVFIEEKKKSQTSKTEIKRRRNTEEAHWCCCNVFYCFYFQFVFRCKPIEDEDIYETQKSDLTSVTTKNAEEYWMKRYTDYVKKFEEYDQEKSRNPNTKMKEPSKPSLAAALLFGVGTYKLVAATSLIVLIYASYFVQPYMMKLILEVVARKVFNPNETFPYAPAIILILFPFMNIINSFKLRFFFHYCANAKSALSGMIYNKTLLLNITSQSNVDTGRLLSLLAADTQNICYMIWMPFMLAFIPIELIIPFVFVCIDFGWVGIMSLIILFLFFPVQVFLSSLLAGSLKKYLSHNDDRNKVTNETLQGMRVVKFTGLEQVFINKIEIPRRKQERDVFVFTFWQQFMSGMIRAMPPLVNIATFGTYIAIYNVDQFDFPVKVMPNIGFLTMMTRETNMIPTYLQGTAMVHVSQKRIRDFLILPELKKEVINEPSDAEVALTITNGTFKWGDFPEIPLSMDEKMKLKEEAERRKMENAKQIAEKKDGAKANNDNQGDQKDNVKSEQTPIPTIFDEDKASSSTSSSSSTAEKVEETKEEKKEEKKEETNTETASGLAKTSESAPEENNEPAVVTQSTTISAPVATTASDAQPSVFTLSDQPKDEKGSAQENTTPVISAQSSTLSPSTAPSSSPSPSPSPSATPSSRNKIALQSVNITLPKGSLTMVVGGVGSGKSSIGAAIIGDMDRLEGEVRYRGSIAYCPQVAWINNSTVRGNIIFGSFYEEEKYLNVVRVCALEPDFRTLSAGDQTAIGEKGVNLSGGQKARIQLARAVYSDRDIYILDDPLSAVDAHVGRYLLEECICGQLKDKTRLLMTNQLQFLDRADNIILLKHGHISAQGKYEDLLAQGIDFSQFIIKKKGKKDKKHKEGEDEEDSESDGEEEEEEGNEKQEGEEGKEGEKMEKKTGKTHKHSDHYKHHAKSDQSTGATAKDLEGKGAEAGKQIITEEEFETEAVPISNYVSYVSSLFPWWGFIIYILLAIIAEGTQIFQSYWLGIVGNPLKLDVIPYGWKIGMYGLMCVFGFIFQSLRAVVSGFAVVRSVHIIHNTLLKNVMHCPPSFFDTTPMGRILNRFTGDMSQVDTSLFGLLIQVINLVIGIIGQVVIIAIDTPVFLAVGLPAVLAYFVIYVLYARAARNLQRLEAISRSPVLSIFGETVNGAGLSTIRAFHLEESWRQKFYKANDDWSVRYVLYLEGKSWADMYTQLVTIIFSTGVIILGWFYMEPSILSVAITASMTFSFLGSFMVMESVDLESRMTSYQRLDFYSSHLPQELEYSKINKKVAIEPPADWPQKGNVNFEHVTFRYRPGLPYVLQDVNFSFAGGEKIGVCGRTGAGKTSLLFALFRLVELDPSLQPIMIDMETGKPVDAPDEEPNKGRVLIDGIDISKVDLGRVRRSIAIIPQDPTLFTGTLRYNLDIGSKCSDDEIWEVLDLIEMKEVVLGMEFGLDTQMSEGGNNFSCGQRQLICFGRAMLNQCKIVVMDEATANVDVETDAKIQKTIRRVFSSQTMIIIAHRLNTIMNCDRIMVMDQGHVSELDSPANLLANPSSAFNGLIQSLSE